MGAVDKAARAQEALAKIRAGVRSKRFRMPLAAGDPLEIEIRLLSGSEQHQATAAAARRLADEGKESDHQDFDSYVMIESVALAVCLPGGEHRLFESRVHMEDELYENQIGFLVLAYNELDRELDPTVELLGGKDAFASEIADLLQKKELTQLRGIVATAPHLYLLTTVELLLSSLEEKSSSISSSAEAS